MSLKLEPERKNIIEPSGYGYDCRALASIPTYPHLPSPISCLPSIAEPATIPQAAADHLTHTHTHTHTQREREREAGRETTGRGCQPGVSVYEEWAQTRGW